MASHNILGKFGEGLAQRYLTERAFTLIHTNWKHSYYEIDIIATKENVLHFIEVKTRRSHQYGLPEESVDTKKMKKLMVAAEAYLYAHPGWKRVQYDVLAISIEKQNQPEFFFIEDVYL